MKNSLRFSCTRALALLFSLAALATEVAAQTGYETGFENIARITGNLHHILERNQKAGLYPMPVLLPNLTMPYLQTHESLAPNPIRAVYLSRGFVELVNFISHAKAIDAVSRGFLVKSMARLSLEGADGNVPELRANAVRNSWSFATMNCQASYFNQIAGCLAAIDLAHFSLGHYQKYASQLISAQNQSVPLNSLVTTAEWRAAVIQGAGYGLECGLAVDGLKIVFDSIDKMPTRPAWRIYFIPEEITAKEIARINRELDQVQRKAFLSFDH